jgi:hypothetical protein
MSRLSERNIRVCVFMTAISWTVRGFFERPERARGQRQASLIELTRGAEVAPTSQQVSSASHRSSAVDALKKIQLPAIRAIGFSS